MAFPSIQSPAYPLGESSFKRQIRVPFESGHVHSRAGATVARKIWQLNWKMLPESEYQTLLTFFEANIGGTFSWTHPVTETTYTVRFAEDTLQGNIPFRGYREVSLKLEEAP